MRLIVTLAAAVALAATACTDPADPSASDASDAPPPASPAAAPHAYHSDLENTVVLAMRRGNTGEDLLSQIGMVAKRHGLDDWTSAEETFTAIGAGMRQAGVAGERAEIVAELVSGGDASHRRLVLEAYGG